MGHTMTANEPRSESVTANITLGCADWRIETRVTVPTGPIQPVELLPVIQSFADGVARSVAEATEQTGTKISCKKGCGACCRQVVPLSELEVLQLRELVCAMPEPRQARLRRRFEEARKKLDEAGLWEVLRHPTTPNDQADQTETATTHVDTAFALEYFRQGIPCPFLEEESCSIYEDRPVACRQYLVTSPAENCADPSPETVKSVPLPLRPLNALLRFTAARCGTPVRWLPLIVALEWDGTPACAQAPRPGPALVEEFFSQVARRARANNPAPDASPTIKAATGR